MSIIIVVTTFFNLLVLTFCLQIRHEDVNVGTVLFSESDLFKQCWSPDNLALLTSRMILEDLLPSPIVLDIDCNDFVDDLIEYFKEILEVVRRQCQGRKKHVTLLALTDVLGGYLHSYVLPKAKLSYYSGLIDFASMAKLLQLYEELKWFLRTSGQGWAKQTDCLAKDLTAATIPINEFISRGKNSCNNLVFYENIPLKRSVEGEGTSGIFFPLPFFDSPNQPSAIAVPFKSYALRSIDSISSSYLVMKYYIAAYKCLQEMNVKQHVVERFQNDLYSWIELYVIPKLKDDKFYAAFGGILRVRETLASLGALQVDLSNEYLHNKMSECVVKDEALEEIGAVPGGGEKRERSSMILMALLITIFVWFLLGALFVCYKIRANRLKDTKSDQYISSPRRNTPSTSTSKSSLHSRGILTKRSSPDFCECPKTSDFTSSSDYEIIPKTSSSTKKYLKQRTSSHSKTKINKFEYDSPAVIETKQSMKILPSIAEISENSSRQKDDKTKRVASAKKITFDIDSNSQNTSSQENVSRSDSASKQLKKSVPNSSNVEVLPKLSERAGSVKSREQASKCDVYCPDPKICKEARSLAASESTTGTDTTSRSNFDKQIYTCHSSLSGNYAIFNKNTEKPFIFGYDFNTSSSESESSSKDQEGDSIEDSDVKAST